MLTDLELKTKSAEYRKTILCIIKPAGADHRDQRRGELWRIRRYPPLDPRFCRLEGYP